MTEVSTDRAAAEYAQALADITAADLAVLIAEIEAFGLGGELDAIMRTARPGAKVQRRFLPANVQGDILRSALKTAKAQDLVQDVVVGLYAEELGDDVADPSLEQLATTTEKVLATTPTSLVKLTLLGVVYREEVAAPHAAVVLRERFACDLTA